MNKCRKHHQAAGCHKSRKLTKLNKQGEHIILYKTYTLQTCYHAFFAIHRPKPFKNTGSICAPPPIFGTCDPIRLIDCYAM